MPSEVCGQVRALALALEIFFAWLSDGSLVLD